MARGSTEFDDLDSWLGHKTRGGGGKFLSKWKEKGYCDTWMHTARLPLAIWRHPFPTFVITEDKTTKEKVKHVFSKKFVCHEDETVLLNPWHDKETNEREVPPVRCGLCKFNEWLWQQCVAWMETHNWNADTKSWAEVKKGKGKGMDPCKLLFDFISEADDDENTKLYAGGICHFFGMKDLDDDVVEAMKKSKIRGDMSWKQNATVKCEYAFCVVDNDNIPGGVQIAVETQALGEKYKEVITKVWKSQEINIQKTPFCIQWIYKPKELFNKKYDAVDMMKIKPNERILKLIRGEPPSLDQLKEVFNQQSMRATLEKHCLDKDIPWDEFFPTKEQEKKWKEQDATAEEEAPKKSKKPAEADEEEKAPKKSKKPAKSDADESEDEEEEADEDEEEEEDDDDEEVACDNPDCGKPIKLSDTKCKHCGHKYNVEKDDEEEAEEPPPESEKPKMKTRSEIAKEKADAKKPKKPKKKEAEEEDDDNQGDTLPFD